MTGLTSYLLPLFYDTFEDADDDIECWGLSNAYAVELVEAQAKIVVNDDEAGDLRSRLSARYAAALPDDLPVIPKAVGEYIKWGKTYGIPTYMMFSFKFVRSQGFSKLTDEVEDWIINNSDVFARAWLDGVCIVEETGEIVKFEAEKF